jgi:hypothetical protein
VTENGTLERCEITDSIRLALQEPERFSTDSPVELIGKIFDINISNSSFKVDTAPRKVTVQIHPSRLGEVDALRWKKVFVVGTPQDELCRVLSNVQTLRLALDEEEDGVNLPSELRRVEKTGAYQEALRRMHGLRDLPDGWDTYSARSPRGRTLDAALVFLRDAVGVLLDYGIEAPTPFIVPTAAGGVQMEWTVRDRELELEMPEPGSFEFLSADSLREKEGRASRWMAMRLIRWVITGEEV